MDLLLLSVRIALSVGISFLAGFGTIYVFNRIPEKWLCDYDEEPDKGMWGVRIRKHPFGWLFTLLFIGAIVAIWDRVYLYQIAAVYFLWVLLLIAIADVKYMIIPDQLVLALSITAIGFIPFHDKLLSPLFGTLIGGASFMFIGVVGKLIFKKEVLGFGDVKLIAAIGLMAGVKGTAIILILCFFSAALVMGMWLIMGKIKKDDQRPLGPFIAVSAAAFILFRPWLTAVADWYIAL